MITPDMRERAFAVVPRGSVLLDASCASSPFVVITYRPRNLLEKLCDAWRGAVRGWNWGEGCR